MNILSLENVVKKYQKHTAVDHISFDVPKGSLFGLLGPNGAGKTSLIRIITTITMADSGTILFNGEPLNFNHPSDIGYMPEERGLYKKMKVAEQLMYLAQLKGMSKKEARQKLTDWLEKFGIFSWWDKKIEELSKGMQQKVQFIATVMHEPKLLILDEPFSGLDPINTNLIKDEIYELNKKGTSIIFSTHRMEQVEEICEQIVLINNGKKILEGKVTQIKEDYKKHIYSVEYSGVLPHLYDNGIYKIQSQENNQMLIKMEENQHSNMVLKSMIDAGVQIKAFNEILPSINDIFINEVGTSQE
ncbi:MAG: ABC transporter ATP-binding protein [Saprospiraceae bacterium]